MPRPIARLAIAFTTIALWLGLLAATAHAADGVTMTARPLLGGHARVGSWVAIAVDLTNGGPPVTGELRLAAGVSGTTRFSVPVDLPTQSAKTYVIHAQSPSFGGKLTVSLVTPAGVIAEAPVAITVHDPSQLVVGIVAERAQDLARAFRGPDGQTTTAPSVVALTPADLPDRVEAWSGLDRLVWQDVGTDALSTDQIDALAAWVAGGGRLVIIGGTAGPAVLSALPDELLPYRPTTTLDVAPASLSTLLGVAPAGAADVAGLAGPLAHGRALATIGDEAIAAEMPYGSGGVTIVGVDPTVGWLADASGTEALWRRLIPDRTAGATLVDDSNLLRAVSQLPALALPPIGGLLALLAGYIILVGPVNYLVLRRLDRREWAWVSIPLLVVGFTVGAYAMGSVLRGSDVIVHEVAIVKGAADSGRGTGVVYAGVFSPSRRTYQVDIPGGALLSGPVSGDVFGGSGTTSLDIVQGDPSRVRDLAVGFGSLRTIRAELPVAVPTLEADLRLEGDTIVGTIRNTSQLTIDRPSLVLGSNVQTWPNLGPGASVDVRLPLATEQPGTMLSQVILGPQAFPTGAADDSVTQDAIRRSLIDTLTTDPIRGFSDVLPSDGVVLLGWTDAPIVPVDVVGSVPRSASTALYEMPLPLHASGDVTFESQLIRSTVVAAEGPQFMKDPSNLAMGQGSMTVTYRPLALDGTLDPTRLSFQLSSGGSFGPIGDGGDEIAPTGPAKALDACLSSDCPGAPADYLPEVEILDRTSGTWMALPHLAGGTTYAIKDPARYLDPADGTLWVRFQNQRIDPLSFMLGVRIEGKAA